jgi:acetyltransferase-like isoleucine patch superfamily enzyme
VLAPHASVSEYVTIADSAHTRGGADDETPFLSRPIVAADVRLGHGCWVAAHAVVTAGTTIGPFAVVAAGAVVTGDVGARRLAGGVPARDLGPAAGASGAAGAGAGPAG